jgi:quercetin dioxygenase-like cupin family protein
MKRAGFGKVLVWFLGLAAAFGLGTAVGQQTPPKENKGFTTGSTAVIDLGPEIDGMQGRQLRMRVLTLEPGGVVGLHSHRDRPAVVHLLQGTLTEHKENGPTREIQKGTSWAEGKATTHWAENKGSTPAIFVAADVFKP